jgi:kynureninase
MVCIEPDHQSPTYPLLSTAHILDLIDAHAADTAVLLLPGIQYYSGQLFDIKTITAHAQSHGIFVVWDLAHAAGNVPLQLHDWNVDAAAWCSYKYLNSGPGAIGGLFVHERNSKVSSAEAGKGFHDRLSGWWGSNKATRFKMDNKFQPIPGAGGFQVSNPSTNDLTVVGASLEVFNLTTMATLREKSLKLTAYLEERLVALQEQGGQFKIITPRDPAQRGAQLSLQLEEGLLHGVMHELQSHGVIVDERMPDVIRVAPAPIYNNWVDVWRFMEVFAEALKVAKAGKDGSDGAGAGKGEAGKGEALEQLLTN